MRASILQPFTHTPERLQKLPVGNEFLGIHSLTGGEALFVLQTLPFAHSLSLLHFGRVGGGLGGGAPAGATGGGGGAGETT
jgi:hypothetical protein